MPDYYIVTPQGNEGPYSDVELMELMDRDQVKPRELVVSTAFEGERYVSELFEIYDLEYPELDEAALAKAKKAKEEAEAAEEEDEEIKLKPKAAPEEEVLHVGHPSWMLFWVNYAFIGLSIYLGWTQRNRSMETFAVGVAVALVIYFVTYILRHRFSYEITERRVVAHFGLFWRSTREIRIEDIRAINVILSGFRGMLGIGSVEFSSAGSNDGEVKFINIPRCRMVRDLVHKLQG